MTTDALLAGYVDRTAKALGEVPPADRARRLASVVPGIRDELIKFGCDTDLAVGISEGIAALVTAKLETLAGEFPEARGSA